VVVDHLLKPAHFAPKKTMAIIKETTQLFILKKYRFHGLFREIISNTWIQSSLIAFGQVI
jgi:hypothetical protein